MLILPKIIESARGLRMPRAQLLVDSSWLIAQYDRRSRGQYVVSELSKLLRGQLLVPQVALTEVLYLLKRQTGIQGATKFLQEFSNSGLYL